MLFALTYMVLLSGGFFTNSTKVPSQEDHVINLTARRTCNLKRICNNDFCNLWSNLTVIHVFWIFHKICLHYRYPLLLILKSLKNEMVILNIKLKNLNHFNWLFFEWQSTYVLFNLLQCLYIESNKLLHLVWFIIQNSLN